MSAVCWVVFVLFAGTMVFHTWWWVAYLIVASFALMASASVLSRMYLRIRARALCVVCSSWSRSVNMTDVRWGQTLCAKHGARWLRTVELEHAMGLELTGAGERLASEKRAAEKKRSGN